MTGSFIHRLSIVLRFANIFSVTRLCIQRTKTLLGCHEHIQFTIIVNYVLTLCECLSWSTLLYCTMVLRFTHHLLYYTLVHHAMGSEFWSLGIGLTGYASKHVPQRTCHHMLCEWICRETTVFCCTLCIIMYFTHFFTALMAFFTFLSQMLTTAGSPLHFQMVTSNACPGGIPNKPVLARPQRMYLKFLPPLPQVLPCNRAHRIAVCTCATPFSEGL